MKKEIVIGCPGSGKSTFARRLRDETNLPLYYLDMIWHKPDKTNITPEEFDSKLEEILCKPMWIIDGNYLRTLKQRIKQCDTIFFLDIPLESCILGAKSRIGHKREDLPWIETAFDDEFKQYICDFHSQQLPQIYELLKKYGTTKNSILFKTREAMDVYMRNMV